VTEQRVTPERERWLDEQAERALAGELENDKRPDPIVVIACSFCSFRRTAPLQQARFEFDQHRCPRPRPTKRKRKPVPYELRR
jgi:hypothetical protein